MTLASCAPEGTAADFKIGVLEQRRAAVTGRRPSAILRGPFPARAPFLAPPASRAAFPARHLSKPRFNQTHWDGTEQAPGTRNAARATTREQAEPRAPAPPLTRALPAGPPPARTRRQKERGPLTLGDRGLGGPGGGRRDFVPEPPRSPVRFPWGPAPTADQEEEGGEKGTERRRGRDGGPGRVPPSGLGAPEDRRIRAPG